MKRDFSNFIGKMNEKYTYVGIVSFAWLYVVVLKPFEIRLVASSLGKWLVVVENVAKIR
jgi:hypothetical protein